MRLIQTVLPTAEPISTAELKAHMNVQITDDDTKIAALSATARRWVETFCRRQLVASTWELRLDAYWPGVLTLPTPPLLAVSSIQYVDTAGSTQTEAASVYTVDTDGLEGRITLAYGQNWSDTRDDYNAVTVTYVAGSATPFTAVAGTDVLTWGVHTPTDGERVKLTNSGGTLPAGLSTNTDYYVIDSAGSTCKLSATSGGVAIDITDAGTGTHFINAVPEAARHAIMMMAAHWYEHVEAVTDGFTPYTVPMGVKDLLWSERTGL